MDKRVYKISEIALGDDTAAKKTPIYSTECTSGVVWVVKPNQEIPSHMHTTSDDIWVCIQGCGTFYPEKGEKVEVSKGDLIVNAKGEHHAMVNNGTEDLVLVCIVAPSQSDYHPL